MIRTAFALALCLAASQDADRKARELLDKLGSDRIEEPEEAMRKLQELGPAVIPHV